MKPIRHSFYFLLLLLLTSASSVYSQTYKLELEARIENYTLHVDMYAIDLRVAPPPAADPSRQFGASNFVVTFSSNIISGTPNVAITNDGLWSAVGDPAQYENPQIYYDAVGNFVNFTVNKKGGATTPGSVLIPTTPARGLIGSFSIDLAATYCTDATPNLQITWRSTGGIITKYDNTGINKVTDMDRTDYALVRRCPISSTALTPVIGSELSQLVDDTTPCANDPMVTFTFDGDSVGTGSGYHTYRLFNEGVGQGAGPVASNIFTTDVSALGDQFYIVNFYNSGTCNCSDTTDEDTIVIQPVPVASGGGPYSVCTPTNITLTAAQYTPATALTHNYAFYEEDIATIWNANSGSHAVPANPQAVAVSGPVTGTNVIPDTIYLVVTEVAEGCADTSLIEVTFNSLRASIKAFLEGPYNTGTGMMNTDLNTAALLDRFENGNGGDAGETPENIPGNGFADPAPFIPSALVMNPGYTVPANAVDVVRLDIRLNSTAAAAFTDSTYAWLMNDGSLRDFATGTQTYAEFCTPATIALTGSNFHVVVRHRNHLPIMTRNLVALTTGGVTNVDLSVAANVYTDGTSTGTVNLSGVETMISGNFSNEINSVSGIMDIQEINAMDLYMVKDATAAASITNAYSHFDRDLNGDADPLDYVVTSDHNDALIYSVVPF